MNKKSPLGKGLGALFPDIGELTSGTATYRLCGIEELVPNRFQPRREFNEEEQKELIASIRQRGILQPIIVRKATTGYEIIAGERRWRAAQEVGLQEVPIVIREATDHEAAEISLIENLQRADLTPLEEAQAFQTLIDTFCLSQEDIGARVGKDRSTIANTLRLLRLPEEIKDALRAHTISAGHARALLSLSSPDEQLAVFHEVVAKGLSVRATEALIRKVTAGQVPVRSPSATPPIDPQIAAYEHEASSCLQTKVRIKSGKRGVRLKLATGRGRNWNGSSQSSSLIMSFQ